MQPKIYSSFSPERVLLLGFIALIILGSILLMQNFATTKQISFIDALFTATSAVCVTGLTVLSTEHDFTFWGQLIIIILIQIGGLGIMTVTTALLYEFSSKVNIKYSFITAQSLGTSRLNNLKKLLKLSLMLTIIIEAIGALTLFIFLHLQSHHIKESLWSSIFHSISAFCNAGFSLYDNSLESFIKTPQIPATIMLLIILGGLGFPVLVNLYQVATEGKRLTPYSKYILYTTAFLIVCGFTTISIFDWNNPTLKDANIIQKIFALLFQAITPRTAGFDVINILKMTAPSIVTISILMVIGASPASTGGGVKTTTFLTLTMITFKEITKEKQTRLFSRNISRNTISKAIVVLMIYLLTIWIGSITIYLIEDNIKYSEIVFEEISALSTVGLSLGISAKLKPESKLFIILLMFWGRIGIVTFIYSLTKPSKHKHTFYPDIEIPVG